MLLSLLVVVATQTPPTCDEVRRVRAALVAVGEDDRAVRRLEDGVCGRGNVGGGVVVPAQRSAECEQLLTLQALATKGGGNDVNGLVSAVCELGQTVATTSYWANGKLARNGSVTWYWPNGNLAQNGSVTLYWPNGKLARNGSVTWYWPNGQLAQNGSSSFFTPEGRLIDRATLVQLACTDVRACRALKDLPADVQMAWMIALAAP